MAQNKFQKMLRTVDFLPDGLRQKAITLALGRTVPFVGTAGCSIDKISRNEVIVSLENKRKARNHIGQLHAAAMALIAETASGFAVGHSLPDDKIPLIKSLKVDYLKRTKGKMVAVARITEEQIARIENEPKGDILVEVTVTDESGEEPIRCEMLWAWVTKR